ncbi:MAG: hypothetical protein K5893_11765 [Prevotella sp.]|nr:hypothetical protein [Prevotella sp.]
MRYRIQQHIALIWIAIGLTLGLTACQNLPHDAVATNRLPDIYPDYTAVTIPVGIAPLNFAMTDDSITTIDVTIEGKKGGSLHVNGSFADIPVDEWHGLVEQNRGSQLTVSVYAEKGDQWTQYAPFPIYVSPYDIKAWGITYRRIAPSYEMYSRMGLYQRDLGNFDELPLLVNTQVPGACVNCHTNSATTSSYLYHVRGEHGATVINRNGKDEILQARNDSLGGSMVYPSWHPGGRYVAFSTNKTSQMFHTRNTKRIEVYDSSSDVFVYDTESRQILRDTLTMRRLWAENTPAFSHDGRWLYFTTALRQVYPTDYDSECYNLCRVAFDEKTGQLGQQVDTLLHATLPEEGQKGCSFTWPRPSPDGRYLMYTRTDYGYFSIWHPEADLWLLDLQTMESRPLNEANSTQADSFHNWNANGRWFLFTSRRHDGLYSRVYLASVSPDGKVTKPFLLPQHDPKRYEALSLYSFNTPDFSAQPIEAHPRAMGKRLESTDRVSVSVKEMSAKK